MGDALLSALAGGRIASLSAPLLCFIWAVELLRIVHPAPALASAGSLALGAFLLLACTRASGHIRALFLVVVAAAGALASMGAVPEALLAGLRRAQVFGAFLPSVLLLRATVEASPRLARLRQDLEGLDPAATQNWTLYGSHALGTVLNVGAMAVLAPAVTRGADEAQRLRLASSAARGVGTAVMWSPLFVAIGFTSQLVPGLPVWEVMSVGAGLAVIGLALSYLVFTPRLGARAYRASLSRLAPLTAPGVVVVGAVVLASFAFALSGLQSVALVVPLLCAAYLPVLGRAAAQRVARRTYADFSRLADELLIVAGATVLGAVVAALPAMQQLGASVTPGGLTGFALMAAMVFVLVGLGFAGLHPMIGAGILVPILATGAFGVSAVVVVCTAVFAWGLNASISIWTLPVVAASTTFAVPVRDLLSRRSMLFGLLYAIAGLAYLGAVNVALRHA